MLYLKKILRDNNISISKMAKLVNIPFSTFHNKLSLKIDFTIKELELIKSILLDLNIISVNFDIGTLLDFV